MFLALIGLALLSEAVEIGTTFGFVVTIMAGSAAAFCIAVWVAGATAAALIMDQSLVPEVQSDANVVSS